MTDPSQKHTVKIPLNIDAEVEVDASTNVVGIRLTMGPPNHRIIASGYAEPADAIAMARALIGAASKLNLLQRINASKTPTIDVSALCEHIWYGITGGEDDDEAYMQTAALCEELASEGRIVFDEATDIATPIKPRENVEASATSEETSS